MPVVSMHGRYALSERVACPLSAKHVPAPLQVAKVLVLLHNELLQGSTEYLEQLRRQAPAGVSSSKQQTVSHASLCSHAGTCMAWYHGMQQADQTYHYRCTKTVHPCGVTTPKAYCLMIYRHKTKRRKCPRGESIHKLRVRTLARGSVYQGLVQVDNDGTVISHGQEEGSSSDTGSSEGEDNDTSMGDVQEAEKQQAGPIIDEDGFQLVQRSRGRGRRGPGG